MFIFIKPLCLAIAGGVLASSAVGQTALAATEPDTATVPPPALLFQSIFTQYRAYTDQPLERWQDANQQVQSIGGWRAYAKEAHAPEPTNPPPQKTITGGQP